ncbi:alkene reductase [Pseudoxanthomonas jiangsuensis]|uniref:alkene reductase n=1 Tax=Pseudoxanthomonas jiangsuensis TaxID=619688 RepID=UPI0013915FDD|nr:alkene reductase [Pseudoxanthomonas jiangsuensis]KAF1697284.1 alkene reductase [Pseudoxanthomonas jiangsuensis]
MASVDVGALFTPCRLGEIELKNRLIMAPMTRSRALGDGKVPNPLAAIYYAQRASAGLIIAEATQVSPQGVGYVRTPGIHSAEQVAGWRQVTDAVHAAGGVIFAQLWHVGRVSHPEFHAGELPVAPSALKAEGQVFTSHGMTPLGVPRALETDEISGVVDQFRQAARHARDAGFDGVELHGGYGYLLDQFLQDSANQRTDRYGGSIENRVRFPLEVTAAAIEVFGAQRVGYRVSPNASLHAMSDSNAAETFSWLAVELGRLRLAYLHVLEPIAGPLALPEGTERLTPLLRTAFHGPLIVNGGYDAASGARAVASGDADLVAYGVPFLANPDLPARFRQGAPLNEPDYATFYMTGRGDAGGYTDYPSLADGGN